MSNIEIDASEVARRLRDDDLFVLDVRNGEAFAEWRIPGSTNLPIYDDLLANDVSTLEASLDDLPADREIAVVCVAGVTSARAAETLREHGFDASSVADGMNGWGRVHREHDVETAPGVVQVVRPGTGCLSYLVHDGGEAVVVDPSQYLDRYRSAAEARDLEVVGVADTHAHADHVSGAPRLADELGVPYYLHGDDAGELDGVTELEEGDAEPVGDRALDVLHTPGHTHGSVSVRFGDALLAGDTLFLRSVGRPDLEDGSEPAVREAAGRLFDSLERLTGLPDETVVLPGHFGDETVRPLATDLASLREGTTNELLGHVAAGDERAFVDTVVESLSEEPANYNRIKRINWGEERAGDDAEALELGPNNCAAN
jgi:glyoxylase-like metal-dependent hydrolase (beta-lactamase superfamily II)